MHARLLTCLKIVRSIAITSTGVRHTTEAPRFSRPSSSPVSPKKSPGPATWHHGG